MDSSPFHTQTYLLKHVVFLAYQDSTAQRHYAPFQPQATAHYSKLRHSLPAIQCRRYYEKQNQGLTDQNHILSLNQCHYLLDLIDLRNFYKQPKMHICHNLRVFEQQWCRFVADIDTRCTVRISRQPHASWNRI